MTAMSQGQLGMVRAFFCNEFEASALDRATMPEHTTDAISEWIEALENSGLFASAEVRNISAVWASEPEAMVALLVGEVDEIAVKRLGVAVPAASTAIPAQVPSFERAS